jgi:hypothetical protein
MEKLPTIDDVERCDDGNDRAEWASITLSLLQESVIDGAEGHRGREKMQRGIRNGQAFCSRRKRGSTLDTSDN